MNKKQYRRRRDIKSKLMAAICMLLVSSIMMVSTTYAWFTLSTAPEVTGINTAVGANGNLEMALLPLDGDLSKITSKVGDSVEDDLVRNLTWGNLVDLDNDAYGLEQITLYPAAVKIDASGKLSTAAPLQTPEYGADGRVSALVNNTMTATYDNGFSPNANYGVRAVGNASGMTERQLSYRNARIAANSAASLAKQLASASLEANGSALASIAVEKGTSDNPAFTAEHKATMDTIVNDLTKAGGILDQIETAYMQSILAYAASKATGTTDTAWLAVKALVEADGATLNSVVAGLADAGVSITALQTGIGAYNTAVKAVDYTPNAEAGETVENNGGAKQLLAALPALGTGEAYTWAQISPILNKLANPDAMLLNGIKAGEIMQGDNMNQLVNSVAGGQGVNVTMASGGGVYADVADQCGNYTASVNIDKVQYGNLSIGPVAAKMNTAGIANPYLTLAATAVTGAGAPDGGAAGSVPISDMYGYIIDMAFRTNAAESNLLLQVDAANRIYSGQEGVEVSEESTMGNGANMTFTSLNPSFDNDSVVSLMGAIRIVFFDPDSGTIHTFGRLDTANTTTDADGGITAKIKLCDMALTESTQTNYFTSTLLGNGTNGGDNGISYTIYYTTADKTVPQYRSYKVTEGEGDTATTKTMWQAATNTTDTDGKVTATTWGTATETTPADRASETVKTEAGTLTDRTSLTLMPLTQNTATKLSVLVYLDGNVVGNDDVASSGSQSVVGKMNLQFASDGNLAPMEYTPLMEPEGAASSEAAGG